MNWIVKQAFAGLHDYSNSENSNSDKSNSQIKTNIYLKYKFSN